MDDPKLLEVLEVFAARICHDLVGAVGAVSNGVELLSEGGQSADPEVLALISASARTASRRLQYFRTAFGTGSALSATRPLDGARSLAIPSSRRERSSSTGRSRPPRPRRPPGAARPRRS